MATSSLRTQLLKWVVAVLLGLMLLGGIALVYWAPVRGYRVTCEKTQQISCVVERETSSGLSTWHVPLGTQAAATVRVEPHRRGSTRVFLYLNSGTQAVFAAEFEGGAAFADAHAAAAQLNQVFSSSNPVSMRVEARPPSYLHWLTWSGLGVFSLLVLIIYRELFKSGRGSHNLSKPAPHRSAD